MLAGLVLLGLVLAAFALFGGFEPLHTKAIAYLRYVGILIRDWQTYVSPVAALVAVAAYVLLCRTNPARAATVVAVIALIEAAAIRIPTVIFERSVVLRSGPSEVTTRLQALLSGGYSESVRRLAEPDPQTIVLEAKLDRPGLVLVADTFYPGWSATVDDVPSGL
jgi:hypothetical protein